MKAIETRKNFYLRRFANTLTLFRLALGLPVIAALGNGLNSIAFVLILLAAITDIADGYLAREAGGGSIWGARLDPLADKILLTAPLIWLTLNMQIPIWSLWLIITRELIVSAWRSHETQGGPAKLSAKTKTVLQFTSILLMLWPHSWGGTTFILILNRTGWYLFWLSLFFAYYSAFGYLKSQSNSHQN